MSCTVFLDSGARFVTSDYTANELRDAIEDHYDSGDGIFMQMESNGRTQFVRIGKIERISE